MSGAIPNGPCSNDRKGEQVPCSLPLFGDDDDDYGEPPLLPQEIEFSEATITTIAPTEVSANGTAGGSAADPSIGDATIDGSISLFDQIDDNEETADATEIKEDDAAVPLEAPVVETTDGSENSDAAIESNKEHKIEDATTATVVANANQGLEGEGDVNVVMNTDGANEANSEEHKIDEDATLAGTIANQEEIESEGGGNGAMNTNTDEANSGAEDGVNDPSKIDWDAFATELQEETNENEASVSSSGTTNDESGSSNEAVGTSSNTSEGPTKDNLFQEDNVSSGSAHAPETGDLYVEEASQTLFTSPDWSNTQLDEAVEVLVKFDYDLTTANSFNSGTLSVLEDNIASNLAEVYGLVAISTGRRMMKQRRYLRKLTVGDIIALDSKPVDINVADTYECVDVNADNCTPLSGVMTVYLKPGSEEESSKTAILSAVEQGMDSGTYESNEIVKVTYVGTRSNRDDLTVRLEQRKSLDGNESSLVIGLSVFFVAFAALVGLVALHTRKRKRHPDNSANSIGASAEISRNTIGVDAVEFAAPVAPAMNKHDNIIGNTTMCSSGSGDEV